MGFIIIKPPCGRISLELFPSTQQANPSNWKETNLGVSQTSPIWRAYFFNWVCQPPHIPCEQLPARLMKIERILLPTTIFRGAMLSWKCAWLAGISGGTRLLRENMLFFFVPKTACGWRWKENILCTAAGKSCTKTLEASSTSTRRK